MVATPNIQAVLPILLTIQYGVSEVKIPAHNHCLLGQLGKSGIVHASSFPLRTLHSMHFSSLVRDNYKGKCWQTVPAAGAGLLRCARAPCQRHRAWA